jgi:hypothetical protein
MLGLTESGRKSFLTSFQESSDLRERLPELPLDRSLAVSARVAGMLATPFPTMQACAALDDWEKVSGNLWKRLFAWNQKRQAVAALRPLGLPFPEGLQTAHGFYMAASIRRRLGPLFAAASGEPEDALPDDAHFVDCVGTARDACLAVAAWTDLKRPQPVPGDAAAMLSAAAAFDAEADWAASLANLLALVSSSGLFHHAAAGKLAAVWASGQSAAATVDAWIRGADTLEDMVRLAVALDQLPASMRAGADQLALGGASAEVMNDVFAKIATEQALRARLQNDPELLAIDGDRIEAAFHSLLSLSQRKMGLVRNAIAHLWLTHQRSRLLSATGTQVNRHGSGLRQRLYVKGRKALKLRQMLATGEGAEGGDPVYDLCPVWMASPATVAQIFPRAAVFDVVIFDEASQCRIEEALPVLLRGKRVVIAGDQKQLPPTRFFESALADSGEGDAETAEELFYQQQSDAEDLLTAALNLDVREAYLDVHYRSRHQALITFSNEHYYGSRLQPMPGHPRNEAQCAPIVLHRVDGTYHNRANPKEAAAAVALVANLLAADSPPSIGLACFNLTQRDAILDALDEKCAADADFARRLDEAKKRKGRDSFEGLFVKNLENVQGDERDVMIICTTFGPDPKGRFRRHFGALSQADGGRRLNVLVTRARSAVHVLTSIPAAEYHAAAPLPQGAVPNGRLQLYAYLRYAESLARGIRKHQDEIERLRRHTKPELKVWPSAAPSRLATALGHALLEQNNTGAHVHWGNDGFSVDVACVHPVRPADVTVGILTDFSRFHKTSDPVEWDLFRTEVLRRQGWELHRVWSPILFRKLAETMNRIAASHEAVTRRAAPPPEGAPKS